MSYLADLDSRHYLDDAKLLKFFLPAIAMFKNRDRPRPITAPL